MKRLTLLLGIILSISMYAQDTISVVTYNLLNYPGSDTTTRNPYYRTIAEYLDTDILVVSEITSRVAMENFRDVVMNARGPLYSSGTFINGTDTDNAVFFKTDKFQFISNTAVFLGSSSRDANEFKLVHKLSGDTIRLIGIHLKASNTSADRAQRNTEATALRGYTNTLPAGTHFFILGDFNFYDAGEPAYSTLLSTTNGSGYVIDPTPLSGTWNASGYAKHHTQSTRTTQFGGGSNGGLDDRFDIIFHSQAVKDSTSFNIVPNTYKPIGNDGLHYNLAVHQLPNNAVPESVAAALHYASDHLPVIGKYVFMGPTSVNEPVIPTGYALEQNFPNPFNPSTSIRFSLPERSQVRLDVYSVLGSLEAVLAEGGYEAGTYTVSFDASGLSSGVYLYRLQAGAQVLSGKMTLIK